MHSTETGRCGNAGTPGGDFSGVSGGMALV